MTAETIAALLLRVDAVRGERARAEAALAARLAPAFNAVRLLAPGETALSAAFRWMLDEAADHGQGGRFRDLFFEIVAGEDGANWAGARVAAEVPTRDGRGRIDLLIETRDCHRALLIENKPWAGWQQDQLARYLEDQSHRKSVRLLALVGGVDDPSREVARHWREDRTDPAKSLPDSLVARGYDAVVDWVEACAEIARPPTVRAFLGDLAAYCRYAVLIEAAMTEPGETADLILASGAASIRAALDVEASIYELLRKLTRVVAEEAGGCLSEVGRHPVARLNVGGVGIAFALFGHYGHRSWAGITDPASAHRLRPDLPWRSEKVWPRFLHIDVVGERGRAAVEAVRAAELAAVAAALPVLAGLMVANAEGFQSELAALEP